jgi:hypothetical protein
MLCFSNNIAISYISLLVPDRQEQVCNDTHYIEELLYQI